MERSSGRARYRLLWVLLTVAFVVVVGEWGARIGASFGVDSATAAHPAPTAAPHIVTLYSDTVYSNIGPPDPSTLCAELSPEPREVTVESTTGLVLEKVTCKP